jgi:regulator of protease activity HflC (stomatin/prohibitin superfamily)
MNFISYLMNNITWLIPIAALLFAVLPAMFRILREYERGVVFRLGKLLAVKGPGLIILIPGIDRMVKVDLRVITIDVPQQELMTRDNVPASVDAVVYFRVVDPQAAIIQVEDFLRATSLIAQTTLRSVLGQAELDELLSEREKLNLILQENIDRQTDPWGVKVTAVEVKDVILPESMRRVMARQAESERERRAKVINAEGEYQAAEKLVQAAAKIATQPAALQLRFLQTIQEVAGENNTTTILPLPIELLTPFLKNFGEKPAPAPVDPVKPVKPDSTEPETP